MDGSGGDGAAGDGTAVLFPGMGPTRYADVARFMVVNPVARGLLARADRRLGHSVLDELEAAEGDYSESAQVAFMVACVALAEWARTEHGAEASACVGPSFGGKPLSVFCGSLPFEDAVWMTAALAGCMARFFATECRDVVTHSFVRVSGEQLAEILGDLDARGEWADVACRVDRDLHMVSLRERNLEWLDKRIRGFGGLSLYTMRPPLHSAAFGGLRRVAEDEVLGGLAFADPALPVVADHDGAVLRTGAGIRAMLLDGIVRPVDWPAAVRALRGLGVGRLRVCGPDGLFGRVACTRDSFEVQTVDPQAALRPRAAGRR
ncbi:ACP S-malonyltransferase [Actinomadura latina]|uniref:[acyl-carrier-protein] S-malonyltransferase n=1 Tax=Actinomadura latina TaxID=163603 RepID=A0A846ZC60_9ACTN|nr:ACP S-malonyltransferase [Actinomadura latina]NKZ08314.1 ACP S-malonyltransferase [Actinomadura latina]